METDIDLLTLTTTIKVDSVRNTTCFGRVQLSSAPLSRRVHATLLWVSAARIAIGRRFEFVGTIESTNSVVCLLRLARASYGNTELKVNMRLECDVASPFQVIHAVIIQHACM